MRAATVALAALALVAAACTSGEASRGDTPFDVQGAPVETSTVELVKSYRFSPAVIAIDAGMEVTWTNRDDFPHDVTVVRGGDASIALPVGESGSITFEDAGTIYYRCSIHPQQMQGKIVVS